MLIISWNVAGLSTTVNRIHEANFKPIPPSPTINNTNDISNDNNNNNNNTNTSNNKIRNNNNMKKRKEFLEQYFQRHQADIFCLQEHKIPLSQLSTRSEPYGCAHINGYESFWSCCIDTKKRGLNGVVTYVKKGMTISANSNPLGSSDLDEQGRCIMTDHDTFVLFNVYVPASGGQPLSYKMKFLNALRNAMNYQRTKRKKSVILVGDLNITHTKLDVFWKDRVIHVNDILKEGYQKRKNGDDNNNNNNNHNNDEAHNNNDLTKTKTTTTTTTLPKWKLDLIESWPKIEKVLETKKVVPTQTTNSITKQKYDKFRLTVSVNDKQIYLGKHESIKEYCSHCYGFSGWNYIDSDSGKEILAEESNVVTLDVLAELLQKIVGITWDDKLLRQIANSNVATVNRKSPTRQWLHTIIEKDGMIDVFRNFYPNAHGRYTCWHQFTNRRYYNEGARIDYTLVDKSLLQHVEKGNVDTLRCCLSSSSAAAAASQEGDNKTNNNDYNAMTETAALCAATANGRFEPVSFEGGGIIESSIEALETQFGIPHTGMIYTPPSFSDHIAISLLLNNESCRPLNLKLDEMDPLTKRSQPHKSQKSISSFFTAASTSSSNSALSTSAPSGNKATKKQNLDTTINSSSSFIINKKRKGIEKFFTAKDVSSTNSSNELSKRPKAMTSDGETSKSSQFNTRGTTKRTSKHSKGSILKHFSRT